MAEVPATPTKKPIWKRWWFIVIAAIVLIVIIMPKDKDKTAHITAADYEDQWPFTIQGGTLECREDGMFILFHGDDGITYGMNGTAKSWAAEKGWKKIEVIEKGLPLGGAFGDIFERAKALCKSEDSGKAAKSSVTSEDIDEMRIMDSLTEASWPSHGLGLSRDEVSKLAPGLVYETWSPVGKQEQIYAKVPETSANSFTLIGPANDLFIATYSATIERNLARTQTANNEFDDAKNAQSIKMLYRFANLIDPAVGKWVKSKLGNSWPKEGTKTTLEENTFGNRYMQLRYSSVDVQLRAEAK